MNPSIRVSPPDDKPPAFEVITQLLIKGEADNRDVAAIEDNGISLSHAALDRQSNQIANYLIRQGIKRGDRVGLSLDRSIEMVAAIIGILKSGAAYVPLDPDYPAERLAMMREDADLHGLLAHADHAARFPAGSTAVWVWEEIEQSVLAESPEALDVHIDPEDVAYVIFTSGSTGRPKGIAMPHRALVNLIDWQLQRHSFKPGARVLQYSSISFDVSFQEIATTLASGGTLVLISNEQRKDPRTLLEMLVRERIERLFLPFVALRSMIEATQFVEAFPDALREVITAGEQLRVDDAVRTFFAGIEGATLDNQYGPSETHVITAQMLEGNPSEWPDLPSIGTPLMNNSVYILDESMQPVDAGTEGEIYLSGRNLAHGYLHREEYTRQAFVPNPLGIPDRPILYKTGDIGAYNEDGTINYLGRRDHQVKIRGHRVEPGEVNAAAARFPGVEQCLTHALVGSTGRPRLASWYLKHPGSKIDAQALRRHLSDALPEYMVPAFLIEIDAIPYTPSGKVNYKALPQPDISNSQYSGDACDYESDAEAVLAEIWADLLELGKVPRTADFFELGGDSLLAVTLFLKIHQQFNLDLPLATLTHAPTIAALARLIEGKGDDACGSDFRSLQLIQKGEDQELPLFLIHGGKGNVLIFNDLAKALGSHQPVYGFQWSGWDGMRAEQKISEMARVYKEELVRFRPSGPYRIGGNCIGGLIAIELANLLKEEGREIAGPLIVWDTPNLGSPDHHAREPWGRMEDMAGLERLKEELLSLASPSAGRTIKAAPAARTTGIIGLLKRVPGLHPFELWIKALPKIVRIQTALLRRRPVAMELRPVYCLRSMITAVKQYRCPGYDGDILYFRSFSVLGRDFSLPGWWEDPFLGFSALCGGRFEAHVIGREHADVLSVPEAGEILKQQFKVEKST